MIQPDLPTVTALLSEAMGASADSSPSSSSSSDAGPAAGQTWLVPVYKEVLADLETPVGAFLKLRRGDHSFLLESVEGGENLARYSFIGTDPLKVLLPDADADEDPMRRVEEDLRTYRHVAVPNLKLPSFSGGAVGYCTYDAVRHFEPRTRPMIDKQKDVLGIPMSAWMICSSLLVFDHVRHTIKVVAHVTIDRRAGRGGGGLAAGVPSAEELGTAYQTASAQIDELVARLAGPVPPQRRAPQPAGSPHKSSRSGFGGDGAATAATAAAGTSSSSSSSSGSMGGWSREEMEAASNIGRAGYEGFVDSLKGHIKNGDIIQAVPSQRLACPLPGGLTSFDVYRQLRVVNPSPYMFYLEFAGDLQIVGASPEALVKVIDGKVETHPIAGTRRRGKTPEEDKALEEDLLGDEKERAEHIMLVDLGRNDVGRVAEAGTVAVESLMHVERYSHVMHIVSRVTGQLRKDLTVFDAFRAIFPAGTVSGAPKVRAMQLVGGLETERRGIYAGSVGHVSFTGQLDTCIAIRTLVAKAGTLYLQAGGGIVFDSVPADEYQETLNKLGATLAAVKAAIRAHGATASAAGVRAAAAGAGGEKRSADNGDGSAAASGGAGKRARG